MEPQWRVSSPPHDPTAGAGAGAGAYGGAGVGAGAASGGGRGELTPEQRRAVYEEMREAARRNRQQAAAVSERRPDGDARPGVGLAAFLGVPPPGPPPREKEGSCPEAAGPPGRSPPGHFPSGLSPMGARSRAASPSPSPLPYCDAADDGPRGGARLLPRLGSPGQPAAAAAARAPARAGSGADDGYFSVTARRDAAPTPKDGAFYEWCVR